MKSLLLNRDKDIDLNIPLPWNANHLIQDLELTTLFKTMSRGDKLIYEVVHHVVLTGMENDIDTIHYRQEALKDCIKNTGVIKQLYALTQEAIDREKHNFWGIFHKYPGSILNHAREVLFMFVEILQGIRTLADTYEKDFDSEAFNRFFFMIHSELSDDYLKSIEAHLKELKLHEGVWMSYSLGSANKGKDPVLNKIHTVRRKGLKARIESYMNRKLIENDGKQTIMYKLFTHKPTGYTFFVHSRDEGGIRALSAIKDEGVNLVANSLAQSSDHILSFFKSLQTELAFYIGCLNLKERLTEIHEPVCFPKPEVCGEKIHEFTELIDVCLALTMQGKTVGNTLCATGIGLFFITGANQGGKSTFLRSIGIAQLMMQSGMFVAAQSFRANCSSNLCTHYKREEDSELRSGKLDEELSRLSELIDHVDAHSLILFNESLAATNEREGAIIAGQIVKALLQKQISIFFVTHNYQFATDFYKLQAPNMMFLTANRQDDGERTFKITEGQPTQTSYGVDLYDKVFKNKKENPVVPGIQ